MKKSSGMLHHVALVRTDVSEVRIVSIIRVTRIGELGINLAVTSNRRTLHTLLLTATEREGKKTEIEVMEEEIRKKMEPANKN
jgi:hypothetical protein